MRQTKPDSRWEGFHVYGNTDGTFHILVVSGDGGYIFADRFQSREDAEWAAAALNWTLLNTQDQSHNRGLAGYLGLGGV